jgi:hypothetical protein
VRKSSSCRVGRFARHDSIFVAAAAQRLSSADFASGRGLEHTPKIFGSARKIPLQRFVSWLRIQPLHSFFRDACLSENAQSIGC